METLRIERETFTNEDLAAANEELTKEARYYEAETYRLCDIIYYQEKVIGRLMAKRAELYAAKKLLKKLGITI